MKTLGFFLFFLNVSLHAQEYCQGSFKEYFLNANQIRASFFPRGNKFTTGDQPAFSVPFPNKKKLTTIFASSPWIAGMDDTGNIKYAFETYPGSQVADFSVGPLTSIGTTYPDSICSHFDRAWNVFAEDIIRHKQDYQKDFVVNDTLSSIFSWPGNGNPFSKAFNGFTLPETGALGLAPYYDSNSNGIYDPDQGDYPVVCVSCTSDFFPDQMMWMVFNDVLPSDSSTGRKPLRVEFQLTAYAFHCQDDEILNNTIFNRYRIISRAVTPVDSAFFGMWTDYDLGCSSDDFIGSDSLRSTEFIYNADPVDGDVGPYCSTGADTYDFDYPPVQSMTYLSHPMHSLISYSSAGASDPLAYYRLLNGQWTDGSPMRPAGDGYDEDAGLGETKFLFHGDPGDTSSWAAINVLEKGSDMNSVSSVSLGRFNPGERVDVTLAYTFHHMPGADHLGQIAQMYVNIDTLRNFSFSEAPCIGQQLCLDDACVWPGDFDHNGKVDHADYLAWGVLKARTGTQRNGLISWRGHYADEWDSDWDDVNAKHADGNGNGIVDFEDIDVHQLNHLLVNESYHPQSLYPIGNDIVISAEQGYIDKIRNLRVRTGRSIDNVLGISFEIEFDTALFEQEILFSFFPDPTDGLNYSAPLDKNIFYPYAFVRTNQAGVTVNENSLFCRSVIYAFRLRPGKTAPDSTIIRLRNLKGIDPQGSDLHLGSQALVVYKDGIVAADQPKKGKTEVYPNPVMDEVFVLTPEKADCMFYDLQGRMVLQKSIDESGEPVQVSGLPPGLYILRIASTGETIKLAIQ